METFTPNHNQSKCRKQKTQEALSQVVHPWHNSCTQGSGISVEVGVESGKNRRNRKFSVRLYRQGGYTQESPSICLPKHDLNNSDTMDRLTCYVQPRSAQSGRHGLLQGRASNWLSRTKSEAMKSCKHKYHYTD